MKTLTKSQIAYFASWTDEQLAGQWETIGSVADNRVKTGPRKGQITTRALRRSDEILAELKRRRELRLSQPAVVETLRLYRTRQCGYEAAHVALTNLGIESREAESAIHEVERDPIVEIAADEYLLAHPVVGLLSFTDYDIAYEAADDIGEAYDVNEIGTVKSRVIIIHPPIA